MKNKKYNSFNFTWCLATVLLMMLSCERDISEDAVLATFPSTAEIFIDAPIGLGSNFYFPYADSKATAWSVDEDESYLGTASMRIDVPNANDPAGGYAGAILREDGPGRDLRNFDALTFWARASQGVTIGEIGLGEDFMENKHLTTITNVSLGTDWQKIIIPLPDPSRLDQELGMFRYAAGSQGTGGKGYTFWVDELQFEKLGTIAQPRPAIQNGNNAYVQNFIGGNLTVSGLTQTYNTTVGDITTNIAPTFFEFNSSDESVATVDENGVVNIIGIGRSTITATMGGREAEGSLLVESVGEYTPAPTPTRNPESVLSLFSDVYNNRPVDFYNGFYAPYQTTTSSDFAVNGDNVLYYLNFNFVGIEFNQNVPTINGKLATHLHFDIYIPNEPPSNTGLRVDLVDFGLDNSFGGGDDTTLSQGFTNGFVSGEWISIDFNISGLNPRTNLGQIILADIGGTTPPSEFFMDNIYFYNIDEENITPEVVGLPLGFELDNLSNYTFSSFQGATSSIIENPFVSGINNSEKVLRTTKPQNVQFSAGTLFNIDDPVDFSDNQTLKMKVYSPKANIPIRMALASGNGGNQIFAEVTVPTANEWVELEFDFRNVFIPTVDYQRIILYPEFIEGVAGDGSTYYFDDIQLID